jgi:hypothetical protein
MLVAYHLDARMGMGDAFRRKMLKADFDGVAAVPGNPER